MKKSLIALAFGTLGLGIAEFVMMGILPDVAKDLGISIPTAGHFISAYALGVCVGAPVLTLARKYPLKHILLVLVTVIMIGNICAAMAPNYWVLLAARFISGLPVYGRWHLEPHRVADVPEWKLLHHIQDIPFLPGRHSTWHLHFYFGDFRSQ